jgi:hypothetical protein
MGTAAPPVFGENGEPQMQMLSSVRNRNASFPSSFFFGLLLAHAGRGKGALNGPMQRIDRRMLLAIRGSTSESVASRYSDCKGDHKGSVCFNEIGNAPADSIHSKRQA